MTKIFVTHAFIGSELQYYSLFVVDDKGRLWQRTYKPHTALQGNFERVPLPEEPTAALDKGFGGTE